jgi:hypothetical protein
MTTTNNMPSNRRYIHPAQNTSTQITPKDVARVTESPILQQESGAQFELWCETSIVLQSAVIQSTT